MGWPALDPNHFEFGACSAASVSLASVLCRSIPHPAVPPMTKGDPMPGLSDLCHPLVWHPWGSVCNASGGDSYLSSGDKSDYRCRRAHQSALLVKSRLSATVLLTTLPVELGARTQRCSHPPSPRTWPHSGPQLIIAGVTCPKRSRSRSAQLRRCYPHVTHWKLINCGPPVRVPLSGPSGTVLRTFEWEVSL